MDWSLLGFEGLWKVYNTHPAFVHFPIALLPLALFFVFFGIVLKKIHLVLAGRLTVYLALLSLIVTVWTGERAEDSIPHDQALHEMIETHETLGWTTLGVTAALAVWSLFQRNQVPRGKWAFVALLALGSLLALQNGDIGSRMVYLHGAAVRAVPPGMEKEAGAASAAESDQTQPDHGGHDHDHADGHGH